MFKPVGKIIILVFCAKVINPGVDISTHPSHFDGEYENSKWLLSGCLTNHISFAQKLMVVI